MLHRLVMAVGTLSSWLLTGDNFCVTSLPKSSCVATQRLKWGSTRLGGIVRAGNCLRQNLNS